MVATEIANEQVKQLRMQQLGEDWIRAITDGALERLEEFCHPQVSSLMLVPKGLVTLNNAVDTVAKFREWFGACTDFQVEESRVARIVSRAGERLGIYYRFHLLERGTWYVVEQQLYCTLTDDRVEKLHLLCSGFRPVQANDQNPVRDGLLEFHTEESETGSTCAVLTPAIQSRLREMQSGQVLEVRVDDPSAKGDVEAWSRLSGNPLLKVIQDEGQMLRFFVKKK